MYKHCKHDADSDCVSGAGNAIGRVRPLVHFHPKFNPPNQLTPI